MKLKSVFIEIPEKGRAVLREELINCGELAPNEAIVENDKSMISAGTELSRVFEIKRGFSYPVRPGYSAVGRVVEKGSELADIEIGDMVFHSGPHASLSRVSRGTRTQGPMIFPLPEGIDPAAGSILNLGLVAMSGVNATDVKLGDTLAVFGLGAIGLLAVTLYKKLGARVIAVDTAENRCKTAGELGADGTLCCGPDEQVAAIKEMTNGAGVDVAVDVTGASGAIKNAILCCGKYSQAVLLGSPRASFECDMTPVFSAVHMNMIRVTGAFNSLNPVTTSEGSRLSVERNFKTLCGYILDGSLNTGALISHVIKPEEAESAYHGLMYDKDNYRCVVIDWSGKKNSA